MKIFPDLKVLQIRLSEQAYFIVLTEIFSPSLSVPGFAMTSAYYASHHGIGRCHWFRDIVIKMVFCFCTIYGRIRSRASKTREAAIPGRSNQDYSGIASRLLATILGLFRWPLASHWFWLALHFTHLDPQNILLAGHSVVFWGPLAWTIIFGLIFSTAPCSCDYQACISALWTTERPVWCTTPGTNCSLGLLDLCFHFAVSCTLNGGWRVKGFGTAPIGAGSKLFIR